MTDVVQRALDYRQELLADISRVDDFLRIGMYLSKMHRAAGNAAGSSGGNAAPREAVETAKPETPANAETARKTNAFAAAFARSTAAEPGIAAEPQPDAEPETAPRRSLAFRGACEEPESPIRRNIA